MKQSNTFLSEIIATRLSHDLIGNIGAVNNAVELMNEGDEEDKDDISEILNFSSRVLNRRLKFFRLCFGLSNASVKTTDELKQYIDDYLSTLGSPHYQITADINISTPKIYKLVMCAIMMMADIIIKNGKITITQTEDSLLTEVSSDTNVNQTKLTNISRVLNNEEIEENPSTYAPLYYLLSYLEDSGVNVHLNKQTLIIGG